MGARDLVYKHMGLVAGSVLGQACVRLECSRGWVLKHWWPGVTMVGWCGCCTCAAVEGGILFRVGKSGECLASMLNVGWFNEKTYVEKALWSN